MAKIKELTIKPPDKDERGYLRRRMQLMELERDIYSSLDTGAITRFVDFFLPYVDEPKDRDAARDALLDVSRQQMIDLIVAFIRADGEDLVPFQNGNS